MVRLGRAIGVAAVAAAAVAPASARPSPQDGSDDSNSNSNSNCPDYTSHAMGRDHQPYSGGRLNLPYQRPMPECRKFKSAEVEQTIDAMRKLVKDPDLFRLFENCFPNTLDTAIAWHGLGAGTEDKEGTTGTPGEELTFVTTGDINAMWLRDSANQLQSYRSLLKPKKKQKEDKSDSIGKKGLSTIASLFRGTINLQARYIQNSPHCNAFRPPGESGLTVTGGFGGGDVVYPPVDHSTVFECKYELDSLAAFLQLSYDYYAATQDVAFFGRRYKKEGEDDTSSGDDAEFRSTWVLAIEAIMSTAEEMTQGTYGPDGKVHFSPYQFQRPTTVATETLPNGGSGAPVQAGTGMVRSAFRPSDDACTYQLFVPANMMLARYLAACAPIMAQLGRSSAISSSKKGDSLREDPLFDAAAVADEDYSDYRMGHRSRYYHELAVRMTDFAETVRLGIERHGRVHHPVYGDVYAYEVDGFGSHNLMDDANIPSLLSAPLLGYVDHRDPVYQNTRRLVLSHSNPYYMTGPVINGTGGPHVGTGFAWPMSLIVQIMTTDDEYEITVALRQLLTSTDGLGLMHESINSRDQSAWTRQWFSWANGLFGQMMLDLRDRKPHLLATSFQ